MQTTTGRGRGRFRAFLVLSGLVAWTGANSAEPRSDFHTRPICWSKPRIIHPTGLDDREALRVARERISVDRVGTALPADRALSPNGAYAYHLQESPVSESGGTVVTLLIFVERPYLIRVRANAFAVTRHAWVNEKLIHLRLWWGRIAGTDAFFDVENEEIALLEPFTDGGIAYQQWREACNSDAWKDSETCAAPCYHLD